jgi:hypothetical protein
LAALSITGDSYVFPFGQESLNISIEMLSRDQDVDCDSGPGTPRLGLAAGKLSTSEPHH